MTFLFCLNQITSPRLLALMSASIRFYRKLERHTLIQNTKIHICMQYLIVSSWFWYMYHYGGKKNARYCIMIYLMMYDVKWWWYFLLAVPQLSLERDAPYAIQTFGSLLMVWYPTLFRQSYHSSALYRWPAWHVTCIFWVYFYSFPWKKKLKLSQIYQKFINFITYNFIIKIVHDHLKKLYIVFLSWI